MRHHTQFRERRQQTERTIVGVPAWPGQAPRSLGLMFGTAAFLFLLGGLVQVNPIWLWGPFHTYSSTNGAQPDWYLGWLIGGLRLVPSFDLTVGHYTLVPNPFWGGAAFPLVVFGFLYLWPWLERRFSGDYAFHNLLDRPRDAPVRTGIGVGMTSWVFLIFLAGASDRVEVTFGIAYVSQIWVYRVVIWVLPVLFGLVAWWTCRELQAGERVLAQRHHARAEARLARMRQVQEPRSDSPSDG
jgi:ubiquinol-cytochrome c reductase cytochrome b subunit